MFSWRMVRKKQYTKLFVAQNGPFGTPFWTPKITPKNVYGSLFCILSQEMRHTNFFLGAQNRVFWVGAKKFTLEMFMCFFCPLLNASRGPEHPGHIAGTRSELSTPTPSPGRRPPLRVVSGPFSSLFAARREPSALCSGQFQACRLLQRGLTIQLFENPLGHGRSRGKLWTSAPQSVFSCGPALEETF